MDTYLTTMQVAALSIAGMCHALLGSIKVPLARQLQIDESRVGGLVSVFGFTLIPMAFAAGIFADSFGRDTVLVAGFVLLIISVLVLAHLGVAAGNRLGGAGQRAQCDAGPVLPASG